MKRILRSPLAVLAASAVVGTLLCLAGPATAGDFGDGCSDSGYVRNGTVNNPNSAPLAVNDTASVAEGGSVTIDVLANDTDPDVNDHLYVVNTSDPDDGYTCIEDNKVVYQSYGDAMGSDTFSYSITDGDYYRTADVTLTVTPIAKTLPKVIRTKQISRGVITRKGQVKVTNPDPTYSITFYAGDFNRDEPDIHRTIAPGGTTVVSTNRSHLDFETVANTGDPSEEFGGALLYFGGINTITGKVSAENGAEFRSATAAKRSAVKAWRVGR